ncbi:DsbA family oxidoreductase [Neisseria iguanae]|uniref:Disulfide bond formation protein DsbA n=1 Tax=Neisseria iguanae TaxID=90242 RepID=A0A2P7TZS9_9NEIS|nr:DsbA family oxidoreductase [Neisseria iguanae]PSJ80153.1 disulfide bond formation protein DsbA [Neisseria iguanae]
MKITYWSDYACPYCYIAETRLHKALAQLGIADTVEIEMKSFELDPAAARHSVGATVDRFAKKYGLSHEGAARKIQMIETLGKAEGIDFRYASTLYTNTFDAHRLTKFAFAKGDKTAYQAVITGLFDAYFTKNQELTNRETLLDVAYHAGLDKAEVIAMLDSEQYSAEVRNDEHQAHANGVYSVPFFVLNNEYSVTGANSTQGFVQVLTQILQDNQAEKPTENQADSGAMCGVDGC